MPNTSANGETGGGAASHGSTKAISAKIKPLEIVAGANMAERWEVWKAKFEIFMCATTCDGESDTRRNCLLLQFLGDDAYSIYASFNKKYDELTHKQLIELFDAHFKPEKNVEMALYKLITRKQKEDETLDEFVTNLKNLSLACNLDNQRDKIVKAIMIANLLPKFEEVRIHVLMKQDETLENAIKTFDASRHLVLVQSGWQSL